MVREKPLDQRCIIDMMMVYRMKLQQHAVLKMKMKVIKLRRNEAVTLKLLKLLACHLDVQLQRSSF